MSIESNTPSQRPTLIVLVGPTAVGKTALAIALANQFGAEIFNADSRQFYKEMAIGTAKPSPAELAAAPHHFVDFLSVSQAYTAGDFEREAIEALSLYFKTKKTAILSGGSGLFVDAVCNGLDDLPNSEEVRAELNILHKEKGLGPLLEQLAKLDPTTFQKIDKNNTLRVIRALEVCLISGKPFSSFRNNKPKNRPFDIIKIGLTAPRELLYSRINERVEKMIEQGLEKEVLDLIAYKELAALKTIGYREFFEHFEGKIDKESAVELLKRNTRRFAKRQLTWWRRDQAIRWFDFTQKAEILPYLNQKIEALHATK